MSAMHACGTDSELLESRSDKNVDSSGLAHPEQCTRKDKVRRE